MSGERFFEENNGDGMRTVFHQAREFILRQKTMLKFSTSFFVCHGTLI
ncbi:hypothetical protein HSIEG1_2894 [Enterococcus sp. HSIEG1]|nr:hypothetical protein HSIEG1_2894 [Enterococcus sp. HSIEG1]